MRVMIIGCGRVGSTLARMLCGEHEVTIMDLTSDAFRRLELSSRERNWWEWARILMP